MPSTAESLLNTLRGRVQGPVAAAYSGGRDSAVLLWSLVQVLGPQAVTALHVDHGWRSEEERAAEAALVARWTAALGVALVSFGPPSEVVRTEAGARGHRYRSFEAYLAGHPGAVVCLAHHAEDQAETILMRLLNGRSWQGLSGMPERRGAFRRPFLRVSSELIAAVAAQEGIPFHVDSSNADPRWKRNLLRREVFPLLRQQFPNAVGALNAFGAVWHQAAGRHAPDERWRPAGGGHGIDESVWASWSVLERQAELLALANLRGPTRLSRRFLETVCSAAPARGEGAGWVWKRSDGLVSWTPVAQREQKEYFVRVAPGVEYDLGQYRFRWVEGPGDLFVPGVDPGLPWVWRSPSKGMGFSSLEEDWSRETRRARIGSLDPARRALVVQGGLIRAVVDPRRKVLVWSDSGGEKLHNTGIFVTLITVT